jgi:cbb3-type cytochrome oxidase cytochrome c subunit
VLRRIDPVVVEREGIDPSRAYPYPGLYTTEAEAKAAMDKLAASMPEALAAEKTRLFVEKASGPTREGLALVAYLQWLGTYEPVKEVAR